MTGFGAIVKSILKAIEEAASGLRLAFGHQNPKPCPIPVHVPSRRGRRN
jgi:hypothetical protein